jgi:hypothetical protein
MPSTKFFIKNIKEIQTREEIIEEKTKIIYEYKNKKIKECQIFGYVIGLNDWDENLTFYIFDDTDTIRCEYYKKSPYFDDKNVYIGSLVLVFGELKLYNNQIEIKVNRIGNFLIF